ncbi:hypothetical protein Pcinc_030827 [Petrolisthes cinctipes]|uniref:Secreted protein n=1 Tax=Petrolisthes cinctipes TaxID=88211 RepID=A0AAE1EXZ8_PETCI|nr:hypothetical protein Pcinc_030827 [Petrolisthes cinctipes]
MRSGTCGTLLLLLFSLFLLLLVPSARSEGMWCYQCGTGVHGEPDCEDFARASSWTQFWRQCAPDSVCVKSKPAWDDDKLGEYGRVG